jgi:hypothetical protein
LNLSHVFFSSSVYYTLMIHVWDLIISLCLQYFGSYIFFKDINILLWIHVSFENFLLDWIHCSDWWIWDFMVIVYNVVFWAMALHSFMHYLERRICRTYFPNHTVIGKFSPWQLHSFNVITSLVLQCVIFKSNIIALFIFVFSFSVTSPS